MDNAGHKAPALKEHEHISFIDPVWLQQWGLGPQNALDYFALSPFYDKSSNNEQCRMQGLDPRQALKNMTGMEYVLADLPPETIFVAPGQPQPQGPVPRKLFVVKKQLRHSRMSAEVQAVYYIMDGTIYQSPTVLSLVNSRLSKFAFHINNAFEELTKLVEFNGDAQYDWAWNKEAEERRLQAGAARAALGNTGGVPPRVVDKVLMDLVETYIDQKPPAGEGEGQPASQQVQGQAPAQGGGQAEAGGGGSTAGATGAAAAENVGFARG